MHSFQKGQSVNECGSEQGNGKNVILCRHLTTVEEGQLIWIMAGQSAHQPRSLPEGGVASQGVFHRGPDPRGVSEGGVGPGGGGGLAPNHCRIHVTFRQKESLAVHHSCQKT
jgi:hypothetical protein